MDEIERLKEEIKNNDDELLNAQTKISKLLAYLNYEKEDILQEIYLKGKKNQKNWEYQKQKLKQLKNALLLKK